METAETIEAFTISLVTITHRPGMLTGTFASNAMHDRAGSMHDTKGGMVIEITTGVMTIGGASESQPVLSCSVH